MPGTPMLRSAEQPVAMFPDTRWTLIGRLKSGDAECRKAALTTICETYWPAVYTYLRFAGNPPERALEFTQAFFSEIVLGGKLLQVADRSRGKLRSLMARAVKNFACSEVRAENARPMDFAHRDIAHEDHQAQLVSSACASPEVAFERRWASAVLQEALRRAEGQFRERKPGHWRAFELRVVRPSIWNSDVPAYSAVARECGFQNEAEAVDAVRVVRKRVLTFMSAIVAESVEDPMDHGPELESVMASMAFKG